METQQQNLTPEEQAKKGVENTLGVIRVVESLFNALRRGSYPLEVHDNIVAGMNFLGQFHTQLVSQLPPAVVADLQKAAGEPAPKQEEATSGQPA